MKADRSGLWRNRKLIDSEFQKAAQRWVIRIYKLAVEKDHVHAILKIPTRQAYRNFIQRVSGAIALRLKIKWLFRPFTRIIEWGKAFKRVCAYVEMNALEAAGLLQRQLRGREAISHRLFLAGLPPDRI